MHNSRNDSIRLRKFDIREFSFDKASFISTFMTFAQWPDLAIYCLHKLIALCGLTMYLTVQAHTHFFFKSLFENAFILPAKKVLHSVLTSRN